MTQQVGHYKVLIIQKEIFLLKNWQKYIRKVASRYHNKWRNSKLSNIIRNADVLIKDSSIQTQIRNEFVAYLKLFAEKLLINIETKEPVNIQFEDKIHGKSISLSERDFETMFDTIQTKSLILEIPIYDESSIDNLIKRAEKINKGFGDFLSLYKAHILPALKKYATTKDEEDFKNILSGVKQFVSGCGEVGGKKTPCREFLTSKYKEVLKRLYMINLEGEGADKEASKQAYAMDKLLTQTFETVESITSGLVSHSETKDAMDIYIPRPKEEDVEFLLYLILIATNTIIKKCDRYLT